MQLRMERDELYWSTRSYQGQERLSQKKNRDGGRSVWGKPTRKKDEGFEDQKGTIGGSFLKTRKSLARK